MKQNDVEGLLKWRAARCPWRVSGDFLVGIMKPALVSIFAVVVFCGLALPQKHGSTSVPLATEDRVKNPGWWPTKGTALRNEYVGPAACGECHFLRAGTQKSTPMAHAAVPASSAPILLQHSPLAFTSGAYKFEITNSAKGAVYSASDGTNSITQALQWAFGTGEVGQTYVFERNGTYYESRVSFYPALQGLELTLGHHAPVANDLAGALGRVMPAAETKLCFGCHTTASTTGGRFDLAHAFPGVTCEACHGPGAKHVAEMRQGKKNPSPQFILNPARLNPVDAVDFCGACHRTTWDVMLANTRGVANVRFQPYRLEKSRCWGKGDGRLTCMGCHDPHVPLVREPAAYDNQCLTCHASSAAAAEKDSDHPGKACPVSTNKCVTCHMPKYEIPGSHAKFTDHFIRVVNAGAGYPD